MTDTLEPFTVTAEEREWLRLKDAEREGNQKALAALTALVVDGYLIPRANGTFEASPTIADLVLLAGWKAAIDQAATAADDRRLMAEGRADG